MFRSEVTACTKKTYAPQTNEDGEGQAEESKHATMSLSLYAHGQLLPTLIGIKHVYLDLYMHYSVCCLCASSQLAQNRNRI